ncbi:HAD-IIB family hydrolase [Canibacter zhoujuaniae]|uniref:HAD-IIB family hydrolase n=1 Tax=Canibacter zhoujuaniae TaxID=2708343 RepID=UPI00141F3158|nr:HAD-IIB family hydrolase [Canibacter zhoujuaniae]
MHTLPKLVAFDLDDTLAPSKSPVPQPVLEMLSRLLSVTQVAIISGGNFQQFQTQLLTGLTAQRLSSAQLQNLHLLPTCGTHYERFIDGKWQTVYQEQLSEADRKLALETLAATAREQGVWEADTWGNILEDRLSQITFSALGQKAPVAAKAAWDPDGTKKNRLAAAVQELLPHLEVRSGGSTSVDITAKGIDKAYGMRKLKEATGIALDDMLFVGDRLDPAGNDYPVYALGVKSHSVHGWEQTVKNLTRLIETGEITVLPPL